MIQELGESRDSYWASDPTAVFDVGLSGLDLIQDDFWIIDSDCSKHITGNPDLFTSLEPHTTQAMVQTTGNQILLVEGKGRVNLSSKGEINMNEVYFVSSLFFNQLLVGSITDMGFTLVFDNKGAQYIRTRKSWDRE